jgi:hypothetical protein
MILLLRRSSGSIQDGWTNSHFDQSTGADGMTVHPPEKVQWRNVLIFSVLAYALAWALWAAGVLPRLGDS